MNSWIAADVYNSGGEKMKERSCDRILLIWASLGVAE